MRRDNSIKDITRSEAYNILFPSHTEGESISRAVSPNVHRSKQQRSLHILEGISHDFIFPRRYKHD
jgi:hypothetical protein